MISMLGWAVRGFGYPFKGLRMMVSRPRLWPFVAVPVAINAVLYSLAFWFCASRFPGWLEMLIGHGEGWWREVLFYVLATVFGAVLLVVAAYTFTVVGSVLLSPFNDMVSERVEWMETGNRADGAFNMKEALAGAWKAMSSAAGRLALYMAGFLALLLLLLFPPLGTAIYGVAATVYSLFFLAWEFFDYPMDRHRYNFRMKKSTAKQNVGAFMGFGAAAWLLTIIPFLGLVLIPACVIGSTLLFCELRNSGRLPDEIEYAGDMQITD